MRWYTAISAVCLLALFIVATEVAARPLADPAQSSEQYYIFGYGSLLDQASRVKVRSGCQPASASRCCQPGRHYLMSSLHQQVLLGEQHAPFVLLSSCMRVWQVDHASMLFLVPHKTQQYTGDSNHCTQASSLGLQACHSRTVQQKQAPAVIVLHCITL